MYRGQGSIGISAQARSVLVAGRDPHDPDSFVLAVTKFNLGRRVPSLRYRIASVDVPTASGTVSAGAISWEGPSEETADSILAQAPSAAGETRGRSGTHDFLKGLLADGPVPVTDIQAAAEKAGLAWRTVERAKKDLGIRVSRSGFGPGSKSMWSHPDLASADHTPPYTATQEVADDGGVRSSPNTQTNTAASPRAHAKPRGRMSTARRQRMAQRASQRWASLSEEVKRDRMQRGRDAYASRYPWRVEFRDAVLEDVREGRIEVEPCDRCGGPASPNIEWANERKTGHLVGWRCRPCWKVIRRLAEAA
jgi:hypothetical protein